MRGTRFRGVPAAVALGGAAAAAAAAGTGRPWLWAAAVALAVPAGRWTARGGAVGLAFTALLAAGTVAASVVPSWTAPGGRLLAAEVLAVLLPWCAGLAWRQSAELAGAGWERAERLRRERLLVAEQARLRERARIAQDMHDTLGHELSLIALRAGALKIDPELGARHRAAAAEIRASAGAAVERLGEVIGVLREETDQVPPAPSGASVADLVDRAAASGVAVELDLEGAPGGVPPLVARAAYRVVQEALTNVAKHAPDARALVRVAYTAKGVEVRVENGPGGAPGRGGRGRDGRTEHGAAATGGRGLTGLRERVRHVGGVIEYGPAAGGFAVAAWLPCGEDPAPPEPEDAGDFGGDERSAARRRARRRLATAVLLPLVAAAVLTGALRGWSAYQASRSVLDPADFARLRPGQERAEVDRYLPERQAPWVRADEPGGQGVACEYYAMTGDPFDDRSGDVYRLCFRGGTLLTAQALVDGEGA